MFVGAFALESHLSTKQHFLLAILPPHAKLLPLFLTQVVGAVMSPVWAHVKLLFGPEDGSSCHTGETSILRVLVLQYALILAIKDVAP